MRGEQFDLKKDSNDFTYVCADIAYQLVKSFVVSDIAPEWLNSVKDSIAARLPVTMPGEDVYNKVMTWIVKESVNLLAKMDLSINAFDEPQRETMFNGLCKFVLQSTPMTLTTCDGQGIPSEVVYLHPTSQLEKVADKRLRSLAIVPNIIHLRITKKLGRSSSFLIVNVEKNDTGITFRVNPTHSN